MCIQMGKTVDDTNRLKFETQEFYIKSEAQMRELFSAYPEAIENTAKIAARCNVEFTFGKYHLPEFKLPAGYDSLTYLKELCDKGYKERYGDAHPEYRAQMDYEIDMIEKMGFTDYFLIVWDFVNFAKSAGIPVGPGRGSAAGSMVTYALHITEIDPMKYGLFFERFLNPERVTMPDIDMDFGDTRRGEVVDYVRQKYGDDHVAQIVTFGTMAARGAIRDVGRALNFTFAETDVVAKLVPSTLHMTLKEALRVSPRLKEMYDEDPRVKNLIDTAMALEGMPRNTSTHAAGVVITRLPVYDYVPLATNDETTVTEYTMTTLEELGLLKMDFLGLRNITVIDDAISDIRKTEPDFSMARVTDNDPKVMEMLTQGRTAGVFQMESTGMTSVCVGLKPQSIEDLSIIVAAYRPGPMDSIPRLIACKNDPKLVKYKHPSLEPILSVTYGCILYQEQVIEIFRKLAGYSLGQADMVRRAMSKKKVKDIEKERGAFLHGDPTRGIVGCEANGIPAQVAESIYNEMYDFANYAFNKAHSVCYAVIAYQTAWFKYYYPRQYMAALMTSVLDSSTKISEYIAECKAMGIAVLPPDINESNDHFTVVPGGIRFGLAAIKNIGRGFIQKVMANRKQEGPFTGLENFCQRMYGTDLNKRALENLIKCGACDCFGLRRSQLLQIYEAVMDTVAAGKRKNVDGQIGLFDLGGSDDDAPVPEVHVPDLPELAPDELMKLERETTGLYLSGHPMDAYHEKLKGANVVSIGAILESFSEHTDEFSDEQVVNIAGIVQNVKMKTTKNQSMMAYVTLEDDTGSMELLTFSNALGQYGSLLYETSAVVISGRISVRDDKDPQMVVNRVWKLADFDAKGEARAESRQALAGKTLYLKIAHTGQKGSEKIVPILNMFPGQVKTVIYYADTGVRMGGRCMPEEIMLEELRGLLGEKNVVLK
jgi:DNA polymerase-3 subunit alpha